MIVSRFGQFLINILLILLLAQITPLCIQNIKSIYSDILEQKTTVAVVTIKDPLNDATTYTQQMERHFEDQHIKAILLNIDCTTASQGACQAVAEQIVTLKKHHLKPIVSWVQNSCIAGAYLIAAATDYIITTPAAVVGGLGTCMVQTELKKHIGACAEQEQIKNLADDIYHQYSYDIAQQRPKLTLHSVKTWADGKIYTGQQALKVGLVDEIGSYIAIERYIRQKAAIVGHIAWINS